VKSLKNLSIRNKIFLFSCSMVLLLCVGITLAARWAYVSHFKTMIQQKPGREPLIAYLAILNREGQVLGYVSPETSQGESLSVSKSPPQEVRSIKDLQLLAGPAYDVAFSLQGKSHQDDAVHVGFNRGSIDQLLDSSSRALLYFVAALALFFASISYWIARSITRRMSELTRLSDQISRGTLELPPATGPEIKCWDIKKCNEVDCAAYENKDIPCWYVDQTLGCGAGLSGCFPEKIQACYGCEVYQEQVGDELLQLERSLRNMTLRLKSSEAGLRDSEKKYRSLFDSGPNPIFVVERKTFEIIDANQSAQSTYGYSKEELIHRPFTDLGPFDLKERLGSDSKEEPGPQGHTSAQKVRHYKKNKIPFYVNVHSSPMIYGEKEAIIIVTIDITEMMEKDAQLIQAGKMTSLGEMSAGIAHELNQPLNAIRLGNEFLKKMIDEDKKIPEDELYFVVNEVTGQVDRAAAIINRLREFGRKAEFIKEEVAINKPIEGVFAIIGKQLRLQNIRVELDLDEALPSILGHKNRLEQVIFNLVTNARDAIFQKRDRGVGPDHGLIKIRSSAQGGRVLVTISDNGMGIPDQVRDKIFEPFFTTKEAGKGMGLGLSIVYGIVRDYEGEIHVESTEGEGTTFRLTFPVAQDKGAS
jgi:PAS domain S-box-containing protein